MLEIKLTEQQYDAVMYNLKGSGNNKILGFIFLFMSGFTGFIYFYSFLFGSSQDKITNLIYLGFFIFFLVIAILSFIPGFSTDKKFKKEDFSFRIFLSVVEKKSMITVKDKHRVKVRGYDDYVFVDGLSWYKIEEGQEVYILEINGELKCYSSDYINNCIENYIEYKSKTNK